MPVAVASWAAAAASLWLACDAHVFMTLLVLKPRRRGRGEVGVRYAGERKGRRESRAASHWVEVR
nr:unnamed protein product [Digitaria exilis]